MQVCACAGTYPMKVAREGEAAPAGHIPAVFKMCICRRLVLEGNVALVGPMLVLEADFGNRPRLLKAKEAQVRDGNVVHQVNQLVDAPLRPVDGLRGDLCDDQIKRIAILTAHDFGRGDASPFRLERHDKLACTARKPVITKAHADEADDRKQVLPDGIGHVGDGRDQVVGAVL